jgi:hypothetical protein
MPQHQRHRGKNPRDVALFSAEQLPRLRDAVADYSFLLTRGYAEKSALQLVGNRYSLATRQRQAVGRVACSDQARLYRNANRLTTENVRDVRIGIDGYNLLITVESALSGGILLWGRDGAIRDLASIHGSYKKVEETLPAVQAIGRHLAQLAIEGATWYLDAPVSNSGRLRQFLLEQAEAHGWGWRVELAPDPDAVLRQSPDPVVTSDSGVLDGSVRWFPLAESLFAQWSPPPEILDLRPSGCA